MRRSNTSQRPVLIADIFPKVFKKLDIPYKGTNRRLRDLWERAVGPQIASQTIPENVKRGCLYVLASSPAWIHQLQFLKEEIRSKLNELSGSEEFKRLFFVVGEIPVRHIQAPDTKTSASETEEKLEKRDLQMLKQSLASIKDTELRETIERVMKKEIIRRRKVQRAQDT